MIRIATVFSGVGAPEHALKKMKVKNKIVFACDNGEIEIPQSVEEINSATKNMSDKQKSDYVKALYKKNTKSKNYVKTSYMANYDIAENDWYEDIRFLNGKQYKGQVDILVGGSPCQSFSIIGKRAGLNDTRGTLFYEFARLIQEIEPPVFIYENVLGMLVHDKGNTWSVIQSVFYSLGYSIHFQVMNACDYGIPQDRKRIFVIGIKDKNSKFSFPEKIELKKTMFDYLQDSVDAKHYLGKKGFEFVTNPKYKNRAQVGNSIIRTEKANQQFNWNGDFVFVPYEKIKNDEEVMKRAYISYWKGKKGAIRQLSYRECFRLMGFDDSFKIVVPNVPAYRQAGNSIVVNVMEALFKQIFKAVEFDGN